MSRIAVIGFGPGGATAAMKLAQLGHIVDIYEKNAKGCVGHPWYDDIRFDIFKFCGLPAPAREIYTNKGKRLFISPDEKNSLKVPFSEPFVEISVDRKPLAGYFDDLCIQAGCDIYYDTPVEALYTEGTRTAGVIAKGRKIKYDLVIDSSGLHSPFRAQAPSLFGIQAQPGKNDIMFCRRAFFERKPGSEAPDPDRNIYIKHRNGVGLSWCNLNDRDEVDVFVGRIGELNDEEYKGAVKALYDNHDFFSSKVIQKPKSAEISLRRPLSIMVADGYAAIGECAFMTMPMMGSGIEASMKAAMWLVETVKANPTGEYSAKSLWSYQVKYFENLGAGYTFVDVVKRWVLNIDVDILNWLFGCGAVTNEDMGLVSTDENNPNKLTPVDIAKKALIIMQKPSVIGLTGKWMLKALDAKLTAQAIPKEYNAKKIRKWKIGFDSKDVFKV